MPNNQDNGALEEFYLELATNIDVDFIDKIIQHKTWLSLPQLQKSKLSFISFF
jgi:hypothetical protein